MLKEDHKINNLQQMVGSVAIMFGAVVLCVGAYFGVQEAFRPKSDLAQVEFDSSKDLVVARVNGHEIRLSEVVMARAELPADTASLPDALVIETVINNLIERRLLAEAGWKAGLTRDEVIKGRIQFEQEKLLRDHYIASMMDEKITERDIKQLYNERYTNVAALQEVHLWQILVRTREEASAVLSGLESGIRFGDLARQYSIDAFAVFGGDMGYVSADSLLKDVADRVFFVEEGGVSEPFRSSFGWHVLYVEDHRLKNPPPLISVRNKLRQELLEAAMVQELERLRGSATIERVQPPLQAKLDSALIAAQ